MKDFDPDITDSFDDDFDFDFDTEPFSVPPPANSREAVTRSMQEAVNGLAGGLKPSSFEDVTKIAETILPEEIRFETKKFKDVATTFRDDLKEAKKTLKGDARRLTSVAKKTFASDSKLGKLSEKIDKLLDEGKTEPEDTKTREEIMTENALAFSIAALGEQQSEEQAEQKFNSAIQHNILKSSLTAQREANANLGILREHAEKISSKYYRKSLELKYKHLLVAKESSASLKQGLSTLINQLESVVRNTGLPEIVKTQNAEYFEMVSKQRLMEGAHNALIRDNPWVQKLQKRLKSKVSELTASAIKVIDSVEAGSETRDMFEEFGVSGNELAGGQAAEALVGAIGNRVGKLLTKSKNGGEAYKQIRMLGQDPSEFFKSLSEKSDIASVKSGLAMLSSGLSTDNSMSDVVLAKDNLDAVKPLDGRFYTSVVQVIPELLARLIGVQKKEDPSKDLKFDYIDKKFITQGDIVKDLKAKTSRGLVTSGAAGGLLSFLATLEKNSGVVLTGPEKKEVIKQLTLHVTNGYSLIPEYFARDGLYEFDGNTELGEKFRGMVENTTKAPRDAIERTENQFRLMKDLKTFRSNIKSPASLLAEYKSNGMMEKIRESGLVDYNSVTGTDKLNKEAYQKLLFNGLYKGSLNYDQFKDGKSQVQDNIESNNEPVKKQSIEERAKSLTSSVSRNINETRSSPRRRDFTDLSKSEILNLGKRYLIPKDFTDFSKSEILNFGKKIPISKDFTDFSKSEILNLGKKIPISKDFTDFSKSEILNLGKKIPISKDTTSAGPEDNSVESEELSKLATLDDKALAIKAMNENSKTVFEDRIKEKWENLKERAKKISKSDSLELISAKMGLFEQRKNTTILNQHGWAYNSKGTLSRLKKFMSWREDYGKLSNETVETLKSKLDALEFNTQEQTIKMLESRGINVANLLNLSRKDLQRKIRPIKSTDSLELINAKLGNFEPDRNYEILDRYGFGITRTGHIYQKRGIFGRRTLDDVLFRRNSREQIEKKDKATWKKNMVDDEALGFDNRKAILSSLEKKGVKLALRFKQFKAMIAKKVRPVNPTDSFELINAKLGSYDPETNFRILKANGFAYKKNGEVYRTKGFIGSIKKFFYGEHKGPKKEVLPDLITEDFLTKDPNELKLDRKKLIVHALKQRGIDIFDGEEKDIQYRAGLVLETDSRMLIAAKMGLLDEEKTIEVLQEHNWALDDKGMPYEVIEERKSLSQRALDWIKQKFTRSVATPEGASEEDRALIELAGLSEDDLQNISGIGRVRARLIREYLDNNEVTDINELQSIRGITTQTIADIRTRLEDSVLTEPLETERVTIKSLLTSIDQNVARLAGPQERYNDTDGNGRRDGGWREILADRAATPTETDTPETAPTREEEERSGFLSKLLTWGGPIALLVSGLISSISSKFTGMISGITSSALGLFTGAKNAITLGAKALLTGLKTGFGSLLSGLRNTFGGNNGGGNNRGYNSGRDRSTGGTQYGDNRTNRNNTGSDRSRSSRNARLDRAERNARRANIGSRPSITARHGRTPRGKFDKVLDWGKRAYQSVANSGAVSKTVEFTKNLGRKVANSRTVRGVTGNAMVKAVAKGGAKVAAKVTPGLGLLAGLLFGGERAIDGDFSGAALEVASGASGSTGLGLPLMVASEAALAVHDNNLDNAKNAEENMAKAMALIKKSDEIKAKRKMTLPEKTYTEAKTRTTKFEAELAKLRKQKEKIDIGAIEKSLASNSIIEGLMLKEEKREVERFKKYSIGLPVTITSSFALANSPLYAPLESTGTSGGAVAPMSISEAKGIAKRVKTSRLENFKILERNATIIQSVLGINKIFIIAQQIQENGWNGKVLAGTNNHFNIKADSSWTGKKKKFRVWEIVRGRKVWVNDYFRVYKNADESALDYARFLKTNKRYRAVLNGPMSVFATASALQKAGYATDPNYAINIERISKGKTFRALLKIVGDTDPSTIDTSGSSSFGGKDLETLMTGTGPGDTGSTGTVSEPVSQNPVNNVVSNAMKSSLMDAIKSKYKKEGKNIDFGVTAVGTPSVGASGQGTAPLTGGQGKESTGSYAKSLIGTKYVWGGKDDNNLGKIGIDCSGFVQKVIKKTMPFAKGFPGSTMSQVAWCRKNATPVSAPYQTGDILFFSHGKRDVSHVAIATGPDKMTHSSGGSKNTASNPGTGVKESIISTYYTPVKYAFRLTGGATNVDVTEQAAMTSVKAGVPKTPLAIGGGGAVANPTDINAIFSQAFGTTTAVNGQVPASPSISSIVNQATGTNQTDVPETPSVTPVAPIIQKDDDRVVDGVTTTNQILMESVKVNRQVLGVLEKLGASSLVTKEESKVSVNQKQTEAGNGQKNEILNSVVDLRRTAID